MKNVSIKVKILGIVICSIIGTASLIETISILNTNNITKQTIDDISEDLYTQKEIELKNYVSLAYNSIENNFKQPLHK